MKCSECGLDHADQITLFPKFSRVIAICSLKATPAPDVPIGTIGIVDGHCDDGRARVEFIGENQFHTFHQHEEFIARVRE